MLLLAQVCFYDHKKNVILILLCILLFEVTKPWLICGYHGYKNHELLLVFGFIRVKTMANFR